MNIVGENNRLDLSMGEPNMFEIWFWDNPLHHLRVLSSMSSYIFPSRSQYFFLITIFFSLAPASLAHNSELETSPEITCTACTVCTVCTVSSLYNPLYRRILGGFLRVFKPILLLQVTETILDINTRVGVGDQLYSLHSVFLSCTILCKEEY